MNSIEMGERMRAIRENRGQTVEELANLTGIKAERLKGLEGGKRRMTLNEMCKICSELRIYVEILMHGHCGNKECPNAICPLCHKPNET